MKRIRFLCFAVTAVLLLASLSALLTSVSAYGSTDELLTITHVNVPASKGGSSVIYTPSYQSSIAAAGSFEWFVVLVFDWDSVEKCFVLTKTLGNGYAKTDLVIPENGFIYAINYGQGVNANDSNAKSFDYCVGLKTGAKAYLYGTSVVNSEISVSEGVNWYSADFVSNSYIKMNTPIGGEEAYNPETAIETPIVLPIDTFADPSTAGDTVLFTGTDRLSIKGNSNELFEAWYTVTFDWDFESGCYRVFSVCTAAGTKDNIVPPNGFVVAVSSSDAKSLVENISAGKKAYIYNAAADSISEGACVYINSPAPEGESVRLIPTEYAAPDYDLDIHNGRLVFKANTDASLDLKSSHTTFFFLSDAALNNNGKIVSSGVVDPLDSIALPSTVMKKGKYILTLISKEGENKFSEPVCINVEILSAESYGSSLNNKRIVTFGDSLTAGYFGNYVAKDNIWVRLLKESTGAEVINAGVSGNMITQGYARFKSDVLDLNPDIVIINFGMNDQAAYLTETTKNPCTSLADYEYYLTYFVTELQKIGADVVIVTPNPVHSAAYTPGGWSMDYDHGYMPAFCRVMRHVAATYDCGLVDIYAECTENESLAAFTQGNGIHQSVYGHQRYAKFIGDYLFAAYDGTNKASVEIIYTSQDLEVLAPPYTHVFALGSTFTLPAKIIEGATKSGDDAIVKLKETDLLGAFAICYIEDVRKIKLVSGSKYTITDGYLYLQSDKVTCSELYDQIANIAGVYCNPSLSSDEYVPNGAVLSLEPYPDPLDVVNIVLPGDLTGDGLITALDYFALKRAYLKVTTLSDTEMRAADLLRDGKITASHYFILKKHVLGVEDMFSTFVQ